MSLVLGDMLDVPRNGFDVPPICCGVRSCVPQSFVSHPMIRIGDGLGPIRAAG